MIVTRPPKTRRIVDEEHDVTIQGIGLTITTSVAYINGVLTHVPIGTRITTTGSTGYHNPLRMPYESRRRLLDRAELIYRGRS